MATLVPCLIVVHPSRPCDPVCRHDQETKAPVATTSLDASVLASLAGYSPSAASSNVYFVNGMDACAMLGGHIGGGGGGIDASVAAVHVTSHDA